MFKEYLDPETASTSSAAPKSKTSVATAIADDSKYQTALDTFKVSFIVMLIIRFTYKLIKEYRDHEK